MKGSNTQFRTVKEFWTSEIKSDLKRENTKMFGNKTEIKEKITKQVRKSVCA